MISVVWFKRDLRLHDHRPLAAAAARGQLIPIYVYEPTLIRSPELDASHLAFIRESLVELDRSLRNVGASLILRVGEVVDVLQSLRARHKFMHLWSHEETGQRLTYDRDRAVAEWCRVNGVQWTEFPQTGVIRRLRSRDGWAGRWEARMREPIVQAPRHIQMPPNIDSESCTSLLKSMHRKPQQQRGGESAASETLRTFLEKRGADYQKGMSSPNSAWTSCSRLSPYLTWGNISLRGVYQQLLRRETALSEEIEAGAPVVKRWLASLRSFKGRLHWHCHFIQKLEDEPSIEFENFSRAYDGLRPDIGDPGFRDDWFEAWCTGRTGYPMIDACMRALHATGWINFRMRAMLVSFASYHLWLHWHPTAVFLARHFLDFEPGIHYSQFQMQSGTTGINTVRIYSPFKQALDHDPAGTFVREWLPELSEVPDHYILEPHKMPSQQQSKFGCVIGLHYPRPVVEHAVAYSLARRKIAEVRSKPQSRVEADHIQNKHGSRRSGVARSSNVRHRSKSHAQRQLFDNEP